MANDLHKVRLLDRQGFKIAIIEVKTNVLAGHAILAYDGCWFVFGNIASEPLVDFDFCQVAPPYCMKPDIDDPTIAAADAAVQIGEEAFRAGFNACYEWQIDRRGTIATVSGAEQKRAEDKAWGDFEPSEACKGLIA